MAVRVTQVELVGLLVEYARKRTVDSLMAGVGSWVETFTGINNAGGGVSVRVMRSKFSCLMCLSDTE